MIIKVVYQIPFINTLNAGRSIYNGYKNAFEDLGHSFIPFTAEDNLELLLDRVQPDIFITYTHFYPQKFLDFKVLKKHRNRGMKIFVNTGFWNSPFKKTRINEGDSLKNDTKTVSMIKSGDFGDFFYNVVEQDDYRMDGFEEVTGYKYHTIPLAVDSITLKNAHFNPKFKSDISYIGTYLPQKRDYFKKYVFPLNKNYKLKLYGQDWNILDRSLGFIQKTGEYFNFSALKTVRKPKLSLDQEGEIYNSSTISINIHENYQRKYGGDCNERTFKIPYCGGFEISDDVSCIRKYFNVDEEIVVAENLNDWFEKIDYYIKNPEKRLEIIKKGKERVEKDHTYHNRVGKLLDIYSSSESLKLQ
jgi:spore maturation protein CgeB